MLTLITTTDRTKRRVTKRRKIPELVQKHLLSLPSGKRLSIDVVLKSAHQRVRIQKNERAIQAIQRRKDEFVAAYQQAKNKPRIYGLNTGLGAFKDLSITQSETLQEALIEHHAVAVPPYADKKTLRATLLILIEFFSRNSTIISPEIIERLLIFLEYDALPLVPRRGSVGMADLGPHAALALPLIGKGKILYKGKIWKTEIFSSLLNLSPLQPELLDGLLLCSSVAFTLARTSLLLEKALGFLSRASLIALLSLEAIGGNTESFDVNVTQNHLSSSYRSVSRYFRKALSGSYLFSREKEHLQDPLSFRCIPQIHGTVYETIRSCADYVTALLNSALENPLIIKEGHSQFRAYSHGNFSLGNLSIKIDTLLLAFHQLGTLSANRVSRIFDSRITGLPDFLITLHPYSGLQPLEKLTTSLHVENRHLAHPSSLDSIPISSGIEDFLSAAGIGIERAEQMLKNLSLLLSAELLCAGKALDIRSESARFPLGKYTFPFYTAYQQEKAQEDKLLSTLVTALAKKIKNISVQSIGVL